MESEGEEMRRKAREGGEQQQQQHQQQQQQEEEAQRQRESEERGKTVEENASRKNEEESKDRREEEPESKNDKFQMEALDGNNALVNAVAGKVDGAMQQGFTFAAADGAPRPPKHCTISLQANYYGVRVLPQLQRAYHSCYKTTKCTMRFFVRDPSREQETKSHLVDCTWEQQKQSFRQQQEFCKLQLRVKELQELCKVFSDMLLPASSKTTYKTGTSGTALDCSALPRFIASQFTEKRIWRKKVTVVDQHFRVLYEIRPDQAIQGIESVLAQLAALNGFHTYLTKAQKTMYLFVSSHHFAVDAQ